MAGEAAPLEVEPLSVAFLGDVALAAGALGFLNLVYRRFGGTALFGPLALLLGSAAALGITGSFVHIAVVSGEAALAEQLVRAGLIGSSLALASFAHLITLYPRPTKSPLIGPMITTLYLLRVTTAVLTPTDIVVERFEYPGVEPVAVLTIWGNLLDAPAYAAMAIGVAWLGYLSVRGRSPLERTNGRLLSFAVLPPAFFLLVLPMLNYPQGDPNFPRVETLAFGWGVLLGGGAIYRGWWRPPMPQGLQPIIDASTDAILIVDEQAHVSTANQAARVMADLGDRQPEGLPFIDVLPPELRERGAELLNMSVMGVLRDRVDSNTHQIRGSDPDGRSFLVSVLPVGKGESEAARGALIMVRDETSQIALADATARLANLQDLVIRIMGHDVKTPIAIIQGYAELARSRAAGTLDGKGTEEIRRYMEKVLEAVTSSQLILSNARAISRLYAGPGSNVALEEIDLSRVVRQAGEIMAPLAASRKVELEVRPDSNIFTRAPKGFESVFLNLLSNAVKYTPPGGRVDLTLKLEGGNAVARVSDTGPGIPPEDRSRMFAKFERLDAEKGKIEGEGLGLSIVASFVDLVGGHVYVDDRPDGRSGSVFVVEVLAHPAGAAPTSSSRAGS